MTLDLWTIYLLAGLVCAEACLRCIGKGSSRAGMYLLCLIGWPAVLVFIAWFLWANWPRKRG